MSDQWGGTSLPVSLSGAGLADADLGKADPTAHKLLSFITAVLRAQAGTEWAALRPRPDGDTEGVNVVRKAFVMNPEDGRFDGEKALPGLWLWRRQGRQDDATSDFRHETATFSLAWILPPDDSPKDALRKPFVNATMKAVGAALRLGRDAAWFDAADDDTKAPTRAADDDAVAIARATSTSPVMLSGAGLDGVIGGALMAPRRGVTITTSAAAGAYNTAAPIVVTFIDWLDNESTASLSLTNADGGQTVTSIFEAKQIVSVAIPAQALTTGAIRVGLTAYQGRGSAILKMAKLMSVGLTEWVPQTFTIQILDSDGRVTETKRYFGALGTIQAVEQLVRDPLRTAWPLTTPPAGLDFDVAIDGESVTRAEL